MNPAAVALLTVALAAMLFAMRPRRPAGVAYRIVVGNTTYSDGTPEAWWGSLTPEEGDPIRVARLTDTAIGDLFAARASLWYDASDGRMLGLQLSDALERERAEACSILSQIRRETEGAKRRTARISSDAAQAARAASTQRST